MKHAALLQYVPRVSWRERLRVAVESTGRTQSAIAAEAGIATETLNRVLSGAHAQPSFETVVRIAHAVGENVGTLVGEPAFLLDASQRDELRRVLGYLQRAVSTLPAPAAADVPNASPARSVDIPRLYVSRGARMAYVASGDSMLDAGIADGDVLFVAPSDDVQEANGRIVVCRIRGATFARQLWLRGGRVELRSRHAGHAPIDVDEHALELIGIVVGRAGDVGSPRVIAPL